MFTAFEILIGLGSVLAGGVGGYGATALIGKLGPVKALRTARRLVGILAPNVDRTKLTPEQLKELERTEAAYNNPVGGAMRDL